MKTIFGNSPHRCHSFLAITRHRLPLKRYSLALSESDDEHKQLERNAHKPHIFAYSLLVAQNMASFSGFLRKSPTARLRNFLECRSIHAPDDFDWNSEGRGTKFVRTIEELLSDLPDRQQDEVKAELDLFASIADENGLLAAEQICAGQGIDLERLEGVQDTLLMLAIDHPQIIDRIAAQTSLMRRTGGKGWAAFQFDDDGHPWELEDQNARHAFLKDVLGILNVPDHRRSEADWYESIRIDPITGQEAAFLHATIYVEEKAASELAFGDAATLERHLVQKVLEVGLACDPKARIVEISARGGKKVLDQYAASFATHFAPNSAAPVETPRREVLLDTLRKMPKFETEPADGIERVEVSSLDFFSSCQAFTRIEKRGDDETLYDFLDRRFGATSPLRAVGWAIYGATLRIFLEAREGKRGRTLTVTLRAPNTTTLPNKTEADRHFVFNLLERWKLLAPPPVDVDVVEDLN